MTAPSSPRVVCGSQLARHHRVTAVSSTGDVWASRRSSANHPFGLARLPSALRELERGGEWRDYPNGLDPAPVSAANVCGEPVVIFAHPSESRRTRLSSSTCYQLAPSARASQVVARARRFSDVSIAALEAGGLITYCRRPADVVAHRALQGGAAKPAQTGKLRDPARSRPGSPPKPTHPVPASRATCPYVLKRTARTPHRPAWKRSQRAMIAPAGTSSTKRPRRPRPSCSSAALARRQDQICGGTGRSGASPTSRAPRRRGYGRAYST